MANVSSWRSSQEVRGRRPGSQQAFLSLRRQKRLVAGTDTGELLKEHNTHQYGKRQFVFNYNTG